MFNRPMLIDYQKLEARKNEFQLRLSNPFKLIEQLDGISLSDINNYIREVLLTSAKEVDGTKKQRQQGEVSEKTKQLMHKSREWKHNVSKRSNIEYTELCKTITKQMREETRRYNCQLKHTMLENNKSIKKVK